MMGKRIGFDATAALTQGGGIGRYVRELIHALVAVAPQHQYVLFSARPPDVAPVANPLPAASHIVHRPAPVDERWLYRLWYRAAIPLPVQIFTGPVDLFHSPDFVLPPVGGGIPTLLTVHDLSFVHYPETFPANLVSYLNRAVPRSVRRASHILADSQSTRRDLVSTWGVASERVTVLYSGVHERFRPVADPAARASVRARYNLGEQPIVLTVGTVQPRKNYDMLVRAFRAVAEQHPHQLVIAGGRGWLSEGLLAAIDRLGLGDRIKLIGFVDDADLPTLYSAADLFVFPSLYEGFGLPLLEAMACGVPVISSDASSLPEVIHGPEDDAALLLSPRDEKAWSEAISHLLSSEASRVRLVEAGRAQAARFTWQASARQLAAVYDRLLFAQA